jgi:hypothetical protein
MASRFPDALDPTGAALLPSATLDASQHTTLHQNAIDWVLAVQRDIGIKIAGEKTGSLRLRIDALEKAAATPINGASATSVEATAPAKALWDGATGQLTFEIPRGRDGTNGAPGKDASIVSGVLAERLLAPNLGPQGIDVSFPAGSFTTPPKVLVSPVQKTVGQSAGGTTSSVKTATAGSFRCYSGNSPYGESASTTWQGDKTTFLVGQFSTSNGNQRGLVLLPGGFALPAGAQPTKLQVTFKIGSAAGHALDSITFRPYNNVASGLPGSFNPAATPKLNVVKNFASGTTHTVDLPLEWAAGFAAGTYNAIAFGPNDTANEANYGGVVGASVSVSLTYTLTTPGSTQEVNSRPVLAGVRKVTSQGFVLVLENIGSQAETVEVNWLAV